MKRATLIIPDAGPFNSLWVADQLGLLLALDMPIVVVDAVYDEMTSDPTYLKDRDVRDFIGAHQPPFIMAATDTGAAERARRRQGLPPKKNVGEIAIADFLSDEEGLRHYLKTGDPVVLLFEDADVRVFSKPPNLHLLSTVGLLRGLERVGVISSADTILRAMTHPTRPDRRRAARVFSDAPDGIDEPARIGSTWEPPQPR